MKVGLNPHTKSRTGRFSSTAAFTIQNHCIRSKRKRENLRSPSRNLLLINYTVGMLKVLLLSLPSLLWHWRQN